MYYRTETRVCEPMGDTNSSIEVGNDQGLALSPFLFAVVIDVDELSKSIQAIVPSCTLFANDNVLVAESKQSLIA